MSTDQQHEPKRIGWVRRWLVRLGFTILGVVAYAISINMFSGYPQWHTAQISWVVIIAFSVAAAVIWIVDERRHSDDDD
jgi:type VI protein secretion system component VasK